MASSAFSSTDGGIVSPRDLAVLRLITSANLVGCSMGRSAGFAPFRILSTYTAASPAMSTKLAPYAMSPPASTYSRNAKLVGSRFFRASCVICIRRMSQLQRLKPKMHPRVCCFHCPQLVDRKRIGQDSDALNGRHHLLEQLEPFGRPTRCGGRI